MPSKSRVCPTLQPACPRAPALCTRAALLRVQSGSWSVGKAACYSPMAGQPCLLQKLLLQPPPVAPHLQCIGCCCRRCCCVHAEYTARYANADQISAQGHGNGRGAESMSEAGSEGSFLSSSDDEDEEEDPPTTGVADMS